MKTSPASADATLFLPLSAVDYQLLLVLAERDLYGYAILRAMERESSGTVRLDIGSLYRALARLQAGGLVEETAAPVGVAEDRPGPGRPRRYYHLTSLGREVVRAESVRLRSAVRLAEERALLHDSTRS
jgi:DNA-binding PadR family transcriptional regulator